jgi:hypothetical protein
MLSAHWAIKSYLSDSNFAQFGEQSPAFPRALYFKAIGLKQRFVLSALYLHYIGNNGKIYFLRNKKALQKYL